MIYCDYNASSPLDSNVCSFFSKGDFLLGNPSATHLMGQRSVSEIDQTTNFLHQFFNQPNYQVLYHSGVTEAVNSIFKNFANRDNKNNKKFIYCFDTDHPCVVKTCEYLSTQGKVFRSFPVNKDGSFDLEGVVAQIKSDLKSDNARGLLNFTWVHNETGVVWDLELAANIKAETGCMIHVDATQSIGKIFDYQKLNMYLDFYSYSGHKFGALTGIGFTLYRDNVLKDQIFIHGGGQQQGIRSGTLNTHGIISLRIALEKFQTWDGKKLLTAREKIEKNLQKILGNKGEIVCSSAPKRNLNTIYFLSYTAENDQLIPAFDLQGLIVGTGSACSAGSVKNSRVLEALGYQKYLKSGIRISLDPMLKNDIIDSINGILEKVLGQFK